MHVNVHRAGDGQLLYADVEFATWLKETLEGTVPDSEINEAREFYEENLETGGILLEFMTIGDFVVHKKGAVCSYCGNPV